MPPPTNRAQPAVPAQHPIQDVVPPTNPLGNPQNFTDNSVSDAGSNPIAGTAVAQSSAVIHEQPAGDQVLDSVLQNVTNNLKAAPQIPQKPKKRFGFFGGSKKKQPVPVPGPIPTVPQATAPQPTAQPTNHLQQKPAKLKKSVPVLPILLAILAAVGLAVATIFAF